MYIFFLNRNMSDEHDEHKVFKHEIILPWYKTIQELEWNYTLSLKRLI